MEIIKELELNREYIYDKENEILAEVNFVIDEEYFLSIFSELFPDEKDIDDFLDAYIPEEDGMKIYERAIEDNKIKEEFVTLHDGDE